MVERIELSFKDKKIYVELGHTRQEWEEQYGDNDNYWDFVIDELLDDTIEVDETMVYWLIDGRLYETDVL